MSGMPRQQAVAIILARVSEALGGLEKLFGKDAQLTFIARTPGNPEADVFVSSEVDLDDVIALLERSKKRPQESA